MPQKSELSLICVTADLICTWCHCRQACGRLRMRAVLLQDSDVGRTALLADIELLDYEFTTQMKDHAQRQCTVTQLRLLCRGFA